MTGKESRTSPRQDTERTADSAKRIVRVLHLIAGRFYGGPERQIIGLARAIDKSRYEVVVAAFSEAGREAELISRAKQDGIPAETIFVRNAYDLRAPKMIADLIDRCKIDILTTHGYRSNLLGRRAARMRGIKHLAVSRGWTAENIKVRLYHWLDRTTLKKSDTVVCVSQSKKGELLRAGVPKFHCRLAGKIRLGPDDAAGGLRRATELRKGTGFVFVRRPRDCKKRPSGQVCHFR